MSTGLETPRLGQVVDPSRVEDSLYPLRHRTKPGRTTGADAQIRIQARPVQDHLGQTRLRAEDRVRAVRVATLRRQFFAVHGHYPRGCAIAKVESRYGAGWKDLVKICRSRFQKVILRAPEPDPDETVVEMVASAVRALAPPVRVNQVSEMFLRRIGDKFVLQASEWRQLKKKYLRGKAAGRR
jgi:hypothetical protein